MIPACFRLADHVFPRVRMVAAHSLRARGWSQTRAADALGVSQAMVSKYLRQEAAERDPLIVRLADDLVRSLEEDVAAAGPSPWCTTLTVGGDRPGGQEALEDLLEAERLLRAAPPLRLMPQIGLNIARALPHARDAADVLAYPGRLVQADQHLLPPAPPAFGASRHLAGGLLLLRERDAEVAALANVRGGPDVQAAAERLGPIARLPRGPPPDADERLRRLMARARPGVHLLHDPGAMGLEPCLYVAGASATAVAQAILDLHQVLP